MCKQPYILKQLHTRLMSSFKTYEQGRIQADIHYYKNVSLTLVNWSFYKHHYFLREYVIR